MKRDKFSFKNTNFIIFNNTSHIENIYKKCKVDKNLFHFLAIFFFCPRGKNSKIISIKYNNSKVNGKGLYPLFITTLLGNKKYFLN